MKTLIENILNNNGFVFKDEINGFHQENKSYFFIKEINSDILETVKSRESLNESEWYRAFLTQFNELCSKENFSAVEKNSSLIILVAAGDITVIEQLQSQILLIEEDQFYVKKYVIVYTENALEKNSGFVTNEQLQRAVNNKTIFQNILIKGFTQENEDYIVLLQIFIKLPFLALKFNEEEFITLGEKLKIKLEDHYTTYQELLSSYEQIENLDFLSEESESEINNLFTLITNDPN
ncbi:ABC-three component system middle component 1 [Chryseobacterium sp. SIMBA_029]|uniref:ABC-three component system middle component 1 n=1 Tax=Chryseobacterium sp. SIMBA_029 TaxID=3085772 RepID=UPI00397A450A